jgi:predicted RNase H-like nuclease
LRRAAASRPDGGQIGASAEADAGADRDGTGGRAAASVKPQVTAYTQRAIEIHLQRALGIVPRETLGQGMGPLTARAQHLVRALAESYRLNRNLIEVYPRATVHQLFGARRARRYKRQADPWKSRAEILEELSHELEFAVWREGCLSNDHCFDAVLCAYTAYLWARDGWEMPPEEAGLFLADGWIWVPPAAARGPATGKAGAG